MGIRFTEVSLSVLVALPADGTRSDAALLLQAYNSRGLFAFCERVLFSAPYFWGQVRITDSVPCSIQLKSAGEIVLRAEMQGNASSAGREPLHDGDECWDGPIFLPESPPERVVMARCSLPSSAAIPSGIRSTIPTTFSRSGHQSATSACGPSSIRTLPLANGLCERMPRMQNRRRTGGPNCLEAADPRTQPGPAIHHASAGTEEA